MSKYRDGGPPATREDFWLHFVCGFVVGGLLGFRIFMRADSMGALLLSVLVCAVVTGFLAGRYLDEFWDGLLGWFRRW